MQLVLYKSFTCLLKPNQNQTELRFLVLKNQNQTEYLKTETATALNNDNKLI